MSRKRRLSSVVAASAVLTLGAAPALALAPPATSSGAARTSAASVNSTPTVVVNGLEACLNGIYELRVYTFATASAAKAYLKAWPKHVVSPKAFGITTLKYGLVPDSSDLKVQALVAYPAGSSPEVLGAAYMASDLFNADMAGADMSGFRGVTTTYPTKPQ